MLASQEDRKKTYDSSRTRGAQGCRTRHGTRNDGCCSVQYMSKPVQTLHCLFDFKEWAKKSMKMSDSEVRCIDIHCAEQIGEKESFSHRTDT